MNVLVELKMPNCCHECPFVYETEGAFIDACQHPNGGDFSVPSFDIYKDRPEWCPFNRAKKLVVATGVSKSNPGQIQIWPPVYEYVDFVPLKE